jgi:hypothetical protein
LLTFKCCVGCKKLTLSNLNTLIFSESQRFKVIKNIALSIVKL